MVHNFKKFNKSLVGKSLSKVRGKEYKDDYGKMGEIKPVPKTCLKLKKKL